MGAAGADGQCRNAFHWQTTVELVRLRAGARTRHISHVLQNDIDVMDEEEEEGDAPKSR